MQCMQDRYLTGPSNLRWWYQITSYIESIVVPVRYRNVDCGVSLDRTFLMW
jgi:hypothetical protein